MKKKWYQRGVFFILGLIVGVGISYGISAATGTAGTASDPIVTLSYLEMKIEELQTTLTQNLTDDISEKVTENIKAENATKERFEVIEVPEGTTIYFGPSAEFILRVGEARVIDPNAVGIPDLTDGSKVDNGKIVPIDHHMLVPSDDGRGITIIKNAWIMIKGSYNASIE